ncbi:MAG: hypothetical protein D4R73_02290 [Deltaproteobacteria bacterium]|nr:MAG: hypothetical protein D4R73_02290 [Deltaproteobacteria bacterium]
MGGNTKVSGKPFRHKRPDHRRWICHGTPAAEITGTESPLADQQGVHCRNCHRTGDTLEVTDISMPGQGPLAPGVPLLPMEDVFSMPFKEAKNKLIEEFHTQYITRMLARYGGNVSRAAKELGLKRQYLHRLMRETNVDSKTFKQ